MSNCEQNVVPDQVESPWQVTDSGPTRVNPVVQVVVHTSLNEPGVDGLDPMLQEIEPPGGLGSAGHET